MQPEALVRDFRNGLGRMGFSNGASNQLWPCRGKNEMWLGRVHQGSRGREFMWRGVRGEWNPSCHLSCPGGGAWIGSHEIVCACV